MLNPIIVYMKYFSILTLTILLLTGCSGNLYEPCRPTGHLLNPFGSGCNNGSCLTKEGEQAVDTPSRKGICTIKCIEKGKKDYDGVCNGSIYEKIVSGD
ncbi:hypothetical protein SPONN_2660 [uncultured Candidatus Thioglobus sp.]|nr:hypothetical protein SPONN_2660 [uncultured Candidatus Thioglobus sp.]